eukprot:8026397-Pyramimonas_sp.AAC.1
MTKRAPEPPRMIGEAYLQHGTSDPKKKRSFVVGLSSNRHAKYIEIITELKCLIEANGITNPSDAKQWVQGQ